MLIGFNAPIAGPLSAPDDLAKIVVGAEAMGFDYATFSDHVVIPTEIAAEYPYSASGEFPSGTRGERHEQLTEIAWIAAKTTRLRLVTSVMVVPHRPAVLTAKILSTIDVLSGGRLTLGIGAGWMREEFEAIDAPDFDARGTVTDEYVRASLNSGRGMRRSSTASMSDSPISVSSRSPCRSRIRRSGSEARAARPCDERRASAMPGIRSAPTRRIRSTA